jgi:hypothetical protein
MTIDRIPHVLIPVVRLLERITHPFSGRQWGCVPLTTCMIEACLLKGDYDRHDKSYSHEILALYRPYTPEQRRDYHIRRIAWLVKNGWDKPVEIDVGIPSMNYWPYPLIDGHHRLCAAIYRGDLTIAASVSGSLDYAFELFGVDCAQYVTNGEGS